MPGKLAPGAQISHGSDSRLVTYQAHGESLRKLSAAMDERSAALAKWAADKNSATLAAFSEADRRFNETLREELKMRELLAGSVRHFGIQQREMSIARNAR